MDNPACLEIHRKYLVRGWFLTEWHHCCFLIQWNVLRHWISNTKSSKELKLLSTWFVLTLHVDFWKEKKSLRDIERRWVITHQSQGGSLLSQRQYQSLMLFDIGSSSYCKSTKTKTMPSLSSFDWVKKAIEGIEIDFELIRVDVPVRFLNREAMIERYWEKMNHSPKPTWFLVHPTKRRGVHVARKSINEML